MNIFKKSKRTKSRFLELQIPKFSFCCDLWRDLWKNLDWRFFSKLFYNPIIDCFTELETRAVMNFPPNMFLVTFKISHQKSMTDHGRLTVMGAGCIYQHLLKIPKLWFCCDLWHGLWKNLCCTNFPHFFCYVIMGCFIEL